jgi:malonyl-CoA O-methyltransferase
VPAEHVYPPAFALRAPLSPHAAAELEGVEITMDAITSPQTVHPLVVEGAGGLFVPLNERDFMIDLMARMALPILLVARSTLGTINHTLLSLAALRSRGLPVAGVVLNGPPNAGNRTAIERFGGVRVLAELPRVDPLDVAAVRRLSGLVPPLREIAA